MIVHSARHPESLGRPQCHPPGGVDGTFWVTMRHCADALPASAEVFC